VRVAVLVALGTSVGVREEVGVVEGVTPGGSVTVLDGVVVVEGVIEADGVSAPLVALAAAVPVWIESAVAVCCSWASGVPVMSGEMPDSRTIA
jgi:hypothetical protein